MKSYQSIDITDKTKKIVTLGNFDGVHVGHQKLLNETVFIAKAKNLKSCVLSFFPHPRIFFDKEIKLIQSREQKEKAISDSGIDMLIHLPFTRSIADCSAEEFVRDILFDTLQAAVLVVGYNFRFGKGRAGDVETLRKTASVFGIETIIVPPVYVDGHAVSSSLIREYYQSGNMAAIKKCTGYYPVVTGTVVSGRQLGRTIGFPTANIFYPEELLIPGQGVYAVSCQIDGNIYHGAANIGTNPTVADKEQPLQLEVHLFDFDKDIYQKNLEVTFIEKIRAEKKFSDLMQLKEAIQKDVADAKNILQ